MNREEIKSILPHREPMLLIDEAFLDESGNAHGIYTVKGDEWFLQGHFPGSGIAVQFEIDKMFWRFFPVLVPALIGTN